MNEIIVTHVQPGETLSEIVARHGVSVGALQKWNGIENPDFVLVGQKIVVYKGEAAESFPLEDTVPWTVRGPDIVIGSWDIWIGGAIVLGLLLFLFRRKRSAANPIYRTPSPQPPKQPIDKGQDSTIQHPTFVEKPLPAPLANDGERLVASELTHYYRDWTLINDVLLPSGPATTQIDHILVSPNAARSTMKCNV